ncbi:chromosomal replication initiator protein DnaA [Anaerotardibacter muris]|uniref:chromosomal replication initiator protein DnaA n=1 Tax=Anaerotardibacter muris TaxID=2941505 RepID=UPI00203AECD2|nr:chromosomal replication initiator protein DnaA [Anaerotardibacter muris]
MDIQEVWDRLIHTIKSYPGVNPSQIDAFFSRIQIQAVSPGFIMLTSNNSFIKEWVERHYVKDIKRALEDIYQVEFLVQIEVDTTVEEDKEIPIAAIVGATPASQAPAQTSSSEAEPAHDQQQPNQPQNDHTRHARPRRTTVIPAQQDEMQAPAVTTVEVVEETGSPAVDNSTSRLTFESFVIGDSNRFAYAMATEVAERPGTSSLNPLFIYGRSGVGKTHLMCAIKNYINEQYPDLNVLYIDAEDLVNRYYDAAQEKSVDKLSFKNFENIFKEADVILIDDIQGLQGKEGLVNIVFRIFNANIDQGKQFVFSADRAPKNIDLDERYVSRFNSGATIDIQPPDDATKRSIITNFIQQYQQDEHLDFQLSDEVIDYIVEQSGSNIREIKSAITNVIFAIKMSGSDKVTTYDVKDMLANHFLNEKGERFTIENIQAAVEKFYRVSHSDLVSKKRNKSIKHPRQVAIYLSRELLNMTFKDIGRAFNRDHSTIMHSNELIESGLKEDKNLRDEIEYIRKMLHNQDY